MIGPEAPIVAGVGEKIRAKGIKVCWRKWPKICLASIYAWLLYSKISSLLLKETIKNDIQTFSKVKIICLLGCDIQFSCSFLLPWVFVFSRSCCDFQHKTVICASFLGVCPQRCRCFHRGWQGEGEAVHEETWDTHGRLRSLHLSQGGRTFCRGVSWGAGGSAEAPSNLHAEYSFTQRFLNNWNPHL